VREIAELRGGSEKGCGSDGDFVSASETARSHFREAALKLKRLDGEYQKMSQDSSMFEAATQDRPGLR
jgi:hypothetical protein